MFQQTSDMHDKDEVVIDGLTQKELQATKEFLEEIGLHYSDPDNEPLSWATAVKFLMARKFDVRRAVELFMSHEAVRKGENIHTIDPRDPAVRRELLTEKFTVLPGRDSNGAAIAVFTARHHCITTSTHQVVLKSLIFQLDVALNSQETQRNGLVLIYDMTNSKYSNFDYDLSIKILSMLKGSYPARLKKVLIVTAPLWFKAPFKILRLFVREKLRDRVYTVNINQLSQHLPVSSLPKSFGGKVEVNHKDWIRKCLQVVWEKSSDMDNEIMAYMEDCDNISTPDTGSGLTTPTMDDGSVLSSDLESESSHGTIQEKYSREYKEKELGLSLETSDDAVMTSSPNSPSSLNHLVVVGSNIPLKRSSEPSQMQAQGGDVNPPLPRKKRPNTATTAPTEESIHMPESGGYTVEELLQYCKIKQKKGLCREYTLIRTEPPAGTFEQAKVKANTNKNRYTDVLCMDHSRVHLNTRDSDPHSDYINANFVDGYKQRNAYISTQGPLPRTFGDFWRMVWEQMVLLVVMTTRTVERGRLKCGQYWPPELEDREEYDNFTIINNGVTDFVDYKLTSLILQNNMTGESRKINHLQFLSWPDYGVPHSADAFLRFMHHVRRVQEERTQACSPPWIGHPNGPPILIHCSAGIGRTGTFITVDICTRRLADIGTVNIQKTVRRLRTQRAFSIQMPDQYVFCYLAVLEHAQNVGLIENIDLANFEDSSSDSEC